MYFFNQNIFIKEVYILMSKYILRYMHTFILISIHVYVFVRMRIFHCLSGTLIKKTNKTNQILFVHYFQFHLLNFKFIVVSSSFFFHQALKHKSTLQKSSHGTLWEMIYLRHALWHISTTVKITHRYTHINITDAASLAVFCWKPPSP